MSTRFINLTPHTINLVLGDNTLNIKPSGSIARVICSPGAHINGPFYMSPTYGDVEGLPDPQSGIMYIVSSMVCSRCQGRDDVFSPGTGPKDGAIRDAKGRIEAVTRLIQAPL